MRPDAFAELEAKTGLNPERDLDQVVIAGGPSAGTGRRAPGLVLVSGRFDRYKLSRAIETARKDVTWKDHQGTTVYLFGEGRQGRRRRRLPGRRHARVREPGRGGGDDRAAAPRARRRCATNATLMALLERVKPGSTFWMVGDQSLLANLPKIGPRRPAATARASSSPRCATWS